MGREFYLSFVFYDVFKDGRVVLVICGCRGVDVTPTMADLVTNYFLRVLYVKI